MIRRRLLGAFAVLPLAFAAVLPARAAEPVPVVASFSILADMVRAVGGPRVAVKALVGPDADAHVYQPTPSDLTALAGARLIVVNGLGFEGWMVRAVQASGATAPVVTAAERTVRRKPAGGHGHSHGHSHGHGHGKADAADPHVWQDVGNARIMAATIAEALAAADPAGAADYRAGLAAYDARLVELDAWIKAEIGQITAAKRKVVTSHDAFGHFAAAYGVKMLAAAGITTESEPSAKQVAELIRQLKREKVRAVLTENMTDPRLIRRIADEAGAELGGKLYADALSGPDGRAPTYEAMMRANVATLLAAMLKN